MQEREIPVIADTYVDREFGTGALKITPGHDVNDYAIGKTHSLPTISILNKVLLIATTTETVRCVHSVYTSVYCLLLKVRCVYIVYPLVCCYY
jgi:valyl-tRNA synthetase